MKSVSLSSSRTNTKNLTVEEYNALSYSLDTLGIRYVEYYGANLVPNAVRLAEDRSLQITLEDDSDADASQEVPVGRNPDTAGLSAGSYDLDTTALTIGVEINGTRYVFRPVDSVNIYDLYNSVTGMAKYSVGKSLAYLKKHAVGIRAEAVTRTNDVKVWRSTLESRHSDLSYKIHRTGGLVIEAYSMGRQVGSWVGSRNVGTMEARSQDYKDYEQFSADVAKFHPTAQSVKSDGTGIVMYVDPETSTPVAHWNTTDNVGTIKVEGIKSHVDLDRLLR